jgi:hypothetical protein
MAAVDRCMIEKKLDIVNLYKEEKNVLVQKDQEQSIRANLFPRRAAPETTRSVQQPREPCIYSQLLRS